MRTIGTWPSLAFLLIVIFVPLAAPGQVGGGGAGRGGGRGAQGARLFDPKTVTTIGGEILEVERIPNGRRAEGVHLVIATGSEKLPVHLGPSFYVDRQNLKLAKGDRIEVKGSRVALDGKPALIAQEITRGNESMALRDANGIPLWAGGGARARGW